MKADVDSILYIAITIAILVISAISGRKKKRAKQMQATATQQKEEDIFDPVDSESDTYYQPDPLRAETTSTSQNVQNPFDRLEQFITGQFPQTQSVKESPQSAMEETVSMEGETLETVVDEEEVIMEEIRKSRENGYKTIREDKPSEKEYEIGLSAKKNPLGLFENTDEIKKAIIYNEILKRKYT